jgi:hypothetical protein
MPRVVPADIVCHRSATYFVRWNKAGSTIQAIVSGTKQGERPAINFASE